MEIRVQAIQRSPVRGFLGGSASRNSFFRLNIPPYVPETTQTPQPIFPTTTAREGITLVGSAAADAIGDRHPRRNPLTSRSPGRGRLLLPPLLPRARRHPPPTLRGVAGLLRPTPPPPGDRHPIRIYLQHPAPGGPPVPDPVPLGLATPLFASPCPGRPAHAPDPDPDMPAAADRGCLNLEPGRRLRT